MLWEAIKTIGSIVGMITGLFVVWDRFFRNEPSAFIVAHPLIPGGRQKGAYLRVMNRSERPIIVSWPNGMQPNVMRISLGTSTRDIVVSLIEGETATAIDGQKEFMFPVLKPSNWNALDQDASVDIVIKWRFVQPQIWKQDRSIKVSITKRSWNLIVDEISIDDD